MRGSKHWLVSEVLGTLHLPLLDRLCILVLRLLIASLVPASVHAILELTEWLQALCGRDEILRAGTRHKGSCDIWGLSGNSGLSSSGLLFENELLNVSHVEAGGI
jgi:hypothetical protein